ncbi:MAG: hypothetical protein OXU26_10770 [Acidobacteriota bacterium]|nr:hypothetical protein [Acidobacteriota bacterium]
MKRHRFFQTAAAAGLAGGPASPSLPAQPARASASADGGPARKPRILFYHDGRHPLIYMYEPPMRKEQFESAVDELLGTPVEALMFTMGDGRTVLHDTRVGELWGDHLRNSKWPHLIFRRAYQNAKGLIQAGQDPLRVVCDRARSRGMLIYPVLLVQQGTGKRGEDTRASEFRLNHRHLEIGAGGGVDPSFPGFHGLDFKHEAVRRERFALIEETLQRYPVDGFELQLNYMPYYFRPDEVEAGRRTMTEWIRSVYQAVKGSGEGRELVLRVPASLEQCESVGMDIREWLRQGIVDVLVPQGPGRFDPMLDLGPMLSAARGTDCRIHGYLPSTVDSDRLMESTLPITRAAACNLWDQGVDGLYVAQWFSTWPYRSSFYERLRELPHPDVMAPRDKHYFLQTTTGRYPNRRGRQLPAELEVDRPVSLEFRISDELPRWARTGRVHQVLLRIRMSNSTELDRIEFRLNGKPLPDSRLRKINEMFKLKIPRFFQFGYWYVYKLDVDHWPVRGLNRLEVELKQRDPEVTPRIAVSNLELEIKYLLGKNMRRDSETDLGERESLNDRHGTA